MCCFSHLCLDPWQTWISCFHLHLQTPDLQNIIPPVLSVLSFSGHHPLTHSHCLVLRDTSTLPFCLSFWEWSLCSIYRVSSSDFFIYFLLRIPSLWNSSFHVLGPQARSRDDLSSAHLEGDFPCMFRVSGISGQGFPEAVWTWSFRLASTLCLFQSHKHFLVYYSVIKPNLVNFRHLSLSRM